MMYKNFFLCSLLLCFFALSSQAKPYFDNNLIDPLLIDAPLKLNSAEMQSQVRQIVKMQKSVNVEELDWALAERKLVAEVFVLALDSRLKRENFPKLYHLLDRVGETSKYSTDYIKEYWKEPRPYLAYKNISALISPSAGYSYPSGHTTGGYIYAHILGLIFPQKNQKLLDYAERVSQRRVLVGMHYARDVTAGKRLCLLILGGLSQSKDFQKDLQNAKEEVAGISI